jgi:hypothetical protein
MAGTWAYIQFMDGPPGRPGGGGRPVDPGYGVPGGEHPDQGLPGGEWGGEHPDQGLPGDPDSPGHPGHLPSRPGGGGRPPRPDQGLPGGRPGGRPPRPDQGLPGGGGGDPGQLPVWPVGPDQGLPPIAGQPLPPTDPPPGTVWPPITGIPEVPEGKALVLAAIISSTGKRTKHYFVVNIPAPDQGLPDGGEHPDQGLPPDAETPQPSPQPVPPSAVQTARTPRRS